MLSVISAYSSWHRWRAWWRRSFQPELVPVMVREVRGGYRVEHALPSPRYAPPMPLDASTSARPTDGAASQATRSKDARAPSAT